MISSRSIRYEVELSSNSSEWWRFNAYIMVVGYDDGGNAVSFNNLIDRVYDLDYAGSPRSEPAGCVNRKLSVETDPCDHIDIYIYMVANTFPESPVIKDTPSFKAVLHVSAESKAAEHFEYDVNPWGGLTVAGLTVSL